MRSGARPNVSERVRMFLNAPERLLMMFRTRLNAISDVISDKLMKSKISERISGGPQEECHQIEFDCIYTFAKHPCVVVLARVDCTVFIYFHL